MQSIRGRSFLHAKVYVEALREDTYACPLTCSPFLEQTSWVQMDAMVVSRSGFSATAVYHSLASPVLYLDQGTGKCIFRDFNSECIAGTCPGAFAPNQPCQHYAQFALHWGCSTLTCMNEDSNLL